MISAINVTDTVTDFVTFCIFVEHVKSSRPTILQFTFGERLKIDLKI